MSFSEVIGDKTFAATVTMTAARGRGKSAALGLAVAAAVSHNYSNIFVTAPSPENLGTFFEFVIKGLESLGMRQHADYDLVSDDSKSTVRININRDHRQTVQYISPRDTMKLTQAELLVIDEAAAIPLPVVKNLIGPYVVLLSSTVNGYEGTGRSLSLKLISDLRKQSRSPGGGDSSRRMLKELTLEEPIRYALGDDVEDWLNKLLCLETVDSIQSMKYLPPAQECRLFMVNRDALFSYNEASELFLQSLMSLFVTSHYKNSPNDLMLMSDAPAHEIFVLLPPLDESTSTLPPIITAIQVAMEGGIEQDSLKDSLKRGLRPSGDMIPWTITQQFLEVSFGQLQGVRVVRIATHSQLARMGYASEAMKQLTSFFENSSKVYDSEICESPRKKKKKKNDKNIEENIEKMEEIIEESVLLTENITTKTTPPLLTPLKDAKIMNIDYIGTSFGLTEDLFKFWHRLGFETVYLRQSKCEVTGEHSSIMLREINTESKKPWLDGFISDFRSRFLNSLGSCFNDMSLSLVVSVSDPPTTIKMQNKNESMNHRLPQIKDLNSLQYFFTEFDLERIKRYGQNLADYHLITDLLPVICWLFFNQRIPNLSLSYLQCATLLGLGLQRQNMDSISRELKIPANQAMAFFNKAIHKISQKFQNILLKDVEEEEILKIAENAKIGPSDLIKNSFQKEMEEESSKIKNHLKQGRPVTINV
eukprot:GHVL01039189.1.p1 GENE.GHVL01039189.1~~GHVL01039189.1.p1  ORF type:complete len:705 (+),score=134.14 GHVL01039189.1:910-3024(+)